mmetsp:Transcript_25625/g.35406  ORF Transcript_25625/g.35406 Transcript_25625/m.35406 type:complete len:245 (-) Transcript_25625:36-770(-)
MSTMSGTESIIHVNLSIGSELLGECGIILGLLSVETDVLQKKDRPVLHCLNLGGNFVTNAVISLLDGARKVFLQTSNNWGQAELLGDSLGATQMRSEQNLSTILDQVLNSGDSTTDTGIVSDVEIGIERDVEICANKYTLALQISLGQVTNRLLGSNNLQLPTSCADGDFARSVDHIAGNVRSSRQRSGGVLECLGGTNGGSDRRALGGVLAGGCHGAGNSAERDSGRGHFSLLKRDESYGLVN